jgi:hypothetical protein
MAQFIRRDDIRLGHDADACSGLVIRVFDFLAHRAFRKEAKNAEAAPILNAMNLRILLPALVFLGSVLHSAEDVPGARALVFTKDGAPADPHFFPLAVWLQSPRNAARYKAAGINLYVGLYQGPTPEELATLAKAGMPVICEQNQTGLEHKNDPVIAAWMHGDEPDNAQSLGKGKGYGPPIKPEVIVEEYRTMRAADPSRPVMLNLGQSVAWDNYIGRGVRRNHPEDYPEYIKGCDIASFDIYPVVHDSPEIAGKLEYVAHGVERLVDWTHGEKRVWNCIECTHISNTKTQATPEQVRAEVWMALIRGSRGIVYFVHQFAPSFKEAALLDDPGMLAAVTKLNHQIQEFAPVLNSSTLVNDLSIQSPNSAIAGMLKRSGGNTYLFTVNLRNEPVHASFSLRGIGNAAELMRLDEDGKVKITDGSFSEDFGPYAVRLYKVPTDAGR